MKNYKNIKEFFNIKFFSICTYKFIFLLFCFLPLSSAYAQSIEDLRNRLQSIERNIQDLSREVFKEKSSSEISSQNDSPSNNDKNIESFSSPSNEIRMSDIEVELRRLTGIVESAVRAVDVLEERVDKLVADVDIRLNLVEKKIENFKIADKKSNTSNQNNEFNPLPSEKNGDNMNLSVNSNKDFDKKSVIILPDASVDEQYTYARQLLIKLDYISAERAFRAFINQNKDHKLISNAYYWLGESFYVRQNYAKAAGSFIDGYKLLPKGNKAADSLLKLGMSLSALGNPEQACGSYQELLLKFPEANDRLRKRALQESVKLDCKN